MEIHVSTFTAGGELPRHVESPALATWINSSGEREADPASAV